MKFINASFNTLQKILNEIYQCKTLIHYNPIITQCNLKNIPITHENQESNKS